jgi:tetrahydromethanopterin S-methyltransferase subunit G
MKTQNFEGHEFTLENKSSFSSLYFNKSLKMAILIADTDYIPIDNFKVMFLHISEMIERFEIRYLIFDKQKLRTFHQPSMEWYFAVWKIAMKSKGLTSHYKILPKLDWFEKAVEAGKYEIFQKFGKDIMEGITITYVKSIEEAIETII